MWRARIRTHGIRVKLHGGRSLAVGEVGLVFPGEKIFRGCGADGADACGLPAALIGITAGEVTPVGAVSTY